MTKPVLALCALFALGACAQEDDDTFGYPPVESRYEITDAGPECRGTTNEEGTPEGGSFTRYTCTWERVTVEGVPACYAFAVFTREDEGSPWTLAATFMTSATRCD